MLFPAPLAFIAHAIADSAMLLRFSFFSSFDYVSLAAIFQMSLMPFTDISSLLRPASARFHLAILFLAFIDTDFRQILQIARYYSFQTFHFLIFQLSSYFQFHFISLRFSSDYTFIFLIFFFASACFISISSSFSFSFLFILHLRFLQTASFLYFLFFRHFH